MLCALMFDEMSMRKHIHWDGKKFVGYVDFGLENNDNDTSVIAKDALVFMVNGLNGRWKLPVGYFFTASMTAVEKANLVNACLRFLNDSGVRTVSLTFDGLAANLSMCEHLGASIKKPENLETWFPYPDEPGRRVYIVFDPPHSLKLIRNACNNCKRENNV